MIDISKVPKSEMQIKGHCRVDYTDPITGKVLERIEGDNHVFIDQFMAASFQDTCLNATLLVTDGTAELDTSLPWIPGKPIGYASPSSTAYGLFRGAYRASDSYVNSMSQSGVDSLYVYDFLTSQIPGTIRYVGLTGSDRVGLAQTPYRMRWPRDNYAGVYDIARKRWIGNLQVTLSKDSGGAGSLTVQTQTNEHGAVASTLDLFTLVGSPDNYFAPLSYTEYNTGDTKSQTRNQQGFWPLLFYDYENQRIGVRIRRYCWDYYYDYSATSPTTRKYYHTLRIREDIWTVNLAGTTVSDHYTHSWTPTVELETNSNSAPYDAVSALPNQVGGYAPDCGRLYGSNLITLSSYNPTHVRAYHDYQHVYKENIISGSFSNEAITAGDRYAVTEYSQILYCFGNYMWGPMYYVSSGDNNFVLNGTTVHTKWGLDTDYMGVVPMYDVDADAVYTWCPVGQTSTMSDTYLRGSLIQNGMTNIWSGTWAIKPYFGSGYNANTSTAICDMPFAYTAYKLPSNAPSRPSGSAVTIAYGLSISW